MGQITSNPTPSSKFFPSDYNYLKQILHPAYGEIKIYQNPQSLDYFACRTLQKNTKSFQISLPIKLVQYQTNISSDFLIKLEKYEAYEHKELCMSYNTITMLFEYFPKTLASEFLIRRVNNEPLQEIELLHIFLSILSALNIMKLLGFEYSDLTPDTILLSRSGLCKLSPIDDLTGLSGYNKMLFGSKGKYYSSPEVLINLKEKNEIFESDSEKENIFGLAMILIEGLSLQTIGNFYDLNQCQIYHERIDSILLRSGISESFSFLLRKMLEVKAIERPTYQELLMELDAYKDNFLGVKLHCYSIDDYSNLEQRDQMLDNENNRYNNIFNNLEGQDVSFQKNQNENYGFSSYLGGEVMAENKKFGAPLLNLQEIDKNIGISEKDLQNDNIELFKFKNYMEQIFKEGYQISENIQKKYQALTNRKEIFPDNYEASYIQNSREVNVRKETSPRGGSSVLKKEESNMSITKDYRFFTKNSSSSPFHRNIELLDSKNQNNIKNFDFNINMNNNNSVIKEASEKKKMKSINSTPKKSIKINKNDTKYYTPKRENHEKMKIGGSGSNKKTSMFKERPKTPLYETLYWEALKKKF